MLRLKLDMARLRAFSHAPAAGGLDSGGAGDMRERAAELEGLERRAQQAEAELRDAEVRRPPAPVPRAREPPLIRALLSCRRHSEASCQRSLTCAAR